MDANDTNEQLVALGKRPIGVSVLSMLFLTLGLISFSTGLFQPAVVSDAVYSGLLYAILGWGLWKVKRWAWALAIIASSLGILSGVFSLAFQRPGAEDYLTIGGFVFDVLVIVYVTRRSVMNFYKVGSPFEEFL